MRTRGEEARGLTREQSEAGEEQGQCEHHLVEPKDQCEGGLVWRVPRALFRQWLETLRPVTGAKSQVIHLNMPMIALCGDCLVCVDDSGLRRCSGRVT